MSGKTLITHIHPDPMPPLPPCPKGGSTVTHVGYTAILRGDDYGSRTFDKADDPMLYETENDCRDDIYTVGEDGCVAIAKVTWEEPV